MNDPRAAELQVGRAREMDGMGGTGPGLANSGLTFSDGARVERESRQDRAVFGTTQWSVVLAAGRPESAESRPALEWLCRSYWYPLYAFVRRRGHGPEEARDLTQAFFERSLEKNWLAQVGPQKGRFRTFLLAALSHFLANEWVRERRQKRGGGREILSLDDDTPEARYRLEPADTDTPERLYDRRWALEVLEQTLADLAAESRAAGRSALFEALQSHLSGDPEAAPLARVAAGMGMSEGAVKVAVHRLRRRYGELVRATIRRTVDSPAEVELELAHLLDVLRSRGRPGV